MQPPLTIQPPPLTRADGRVRSIQVPHGFTAGARTEVNRGMLIPKLSNGNSTSASLQLRLHHANSTSAGTSSVAVSWTTATAVCPTPTVSWGAKGSVAAAMHVVTAVTRSYPSARLADKATPAAFHHAVLTGLTPGAELVYTVRCGAGAALGGAAFSAPATTLPPDRGYSFAVFGDMGISTAAHDTCRSIGAVADELAFVLQIGDISYGRGNELVWDEFFTMIEPLASAMPWSVVPGNHDMRPADSAGECGVPMLARFETPRSRAAFPAIAKLSPTGAGAESCDSFNAADHDPFWYTVEVPHATVITYSTDSNYSVGSPQRRWLEAELAKANSLASRAARPWLLVAGHKPMYTSSEYPGELPTRGHPDAGEGTEGSLTAELEQLFVDSKVDASFYGHIHSYNRMYPVKANGAWVDNSSYAHYHRPEAPVHMMIGMSGAAHLGKPYDKSVPWSAYSEISYGWLRATFANASALRLQFVANGDGLTAGYAPAVHDTVWITK